MPTLLLSQRDIQECLTWEDIIEVVEKVFRSHGEGTTFFPAKITLDLTPVGLPNWINAMPAYVGAYGMAGIKWAGGFINNRAKGLPYVQATIILNDRETGVPLSIQDGIWITTARTGAQTAVAAKYLARKDASVVAFIGAGAQARSTLTCLVKQKWFKLDEVRVYDVIPAASERFVHEMSEQFGIPVKAARTNQEAVEGADIIATMTTADEPLVMDEWVKKGAFVSSIGSYQELDEKLVLKADKLLVDSWDQNVHRGELVKLIERGLITCRNIYAEVGDVVAGKKPGREDDKERIVACIIGLGAHDIGAAALAYKIARKKGLGVELSFA